MTTETPRLLAVIRTRGPAWQHARTLEDQEGWRAHADFMNALQAERFVELWNLRLGNLPQQLGVLLQHTQFAGGRRSCDRVSEHSADG